MDCGNLTGPSVCRPACVTLPFPPHLHHAARAAASESSGLPAGQRGTFAGVAAKVDHLKELGVNAGAGAALLLA